MHFKIEIECNNAAFESPWEEIHRILSNIVEQVDIARGGGFIRDDCPIYDYNGNRVGSVNHDID